MKEMTKDLRRAFKESVADSEWMDEATRKAAQLKLEKMLESVGYPNEMLDRSIVEDLYKNLEVDGSSFYRDKLKISKYDHGKIRFIYGEF